MANTEPTSADEDAARTAVALLLADEVTAIVGDDPADALVHAELLDPAGWAEVARRAGADEDYTPSPATTAAAVTVLRDRVTAPDPFASFPS